MWSFVFVSVSLLCLVASASSLNGRGTQKRAHTLSCPLGTAGPGEDLFFSGGPNLISGDVGHCSSMGLEDGTPTCCQGEFFRQVEAMEDPFTESAKKVLLRMSPSCGNKLSEFTCGLCRKHQDSIVQNFATYSEIRLCQSYCQDLLGACNGDSVLVPGQEALESNVELVYENDAARFCSDLFANVNNVSVSVSVDVNEQTGGLSSLWRSHCFSSAKECDESDFEAFYSECNLETDVRSVHYTFNQDSDCRGGQPLPEPVLNLPCHQSCESGSYLPIGSSECIACSAGTHTVSGHFIDQWKTWPKDMDFVTYCEENYGLSFSPPKNKIPDCGWVPNDTYLESGVLDHSQNSILESTFNLVRDGEIGFEYQVFSEPFHDGLIFLIDGEIMMETKSHAANWTKESFPLSAGMHYVRWIFFKDFDTSISLNMAMIDKIYVIGTNWADSQCEQCTPRHYSKEGAEFCSKCPINTYSDEYGAKDCKPCPETHYAPIGADACIERVLCQEEDTTTFYSPCVDDSRVKYVRLNQPVLCDSSQLRIPDDEMVDCADCNPGYFRENDECKSCPAGTYSDQVGATSCQSCDAGTYSPKTLVFTQFETWAELDGLSTSCSGNCANSSTGWRLLGDDIDSGVGHGSIADVYLQLDVTLERAGMLEFYFSGTECAKTGGCRYQLNDLKTQRQLKWEANVTTPSGPQSLDMLLFAGENSIQWVFSKVDPTVLDSPFERFIIHNITITGVASGGSIHCDDCPAGTFSSERSDSCTTCSPGKFSEQKSNKCEPCGDGTFTKETGASFCQSCPPETQSTDDGTDCDFNNCIYSPSPDKVYDLSPLAADSPANVYGPVVDDQNHTFLFNPCNRETLTTNCSFPTFGCQLLPTGYPTMNLGSMLGYYPLNDPHRSGLIMTLTHGSPGCANWREGREAYPRSTNITFICNPRTDRGFPVAAVPVEDPDHPCTYQFRWATKYACPLCTIDDYTPVFGPCIGGRQSRTYSPKNNPNRCTGGIQDPEPEQVPCNISNLFCPPGQYLPVRPDSEGGHGNCTDVLPGHYSIGGGYVFDKFRAYSAMEPPIFENGGTWLMLNDFIRSGEGDTEFSINVFLFQSGEVNFRYKVYAPLLGKDEPGDAGFRFFVDRNEILTTQSTNFTYDEFVSNLPSGQHKLQWRFTGGALPTTQERGNYAVVDRIQISNVTFAARSQIRCPAGTFQPLAGKTSCEICPANTKSHSGASECTDCPSTEYSLPGSSDCELRHRCEPRDIVVRYTDCVENQRLKYYEFLQPQICLPDNPLSESKTEVDCAACPFGYPRTQEGVCEPCKLGSFFNPLSEACRPSSEGYATTLVHVDFSTESEVAIERRRGDPEQGDQEQGDQEQGDQEQGDQEQGDQEQGDQEPGEQVPEDQVPEDQVPEDQVPEDQVPEDQVPEEQVPEEPVEVLPAGFSTISSGGTVAWRLLNNTIESGYHSVAETDSILLLEVEILHEGSIDFAYTLDSLREEEQDVEEAAMLDGLQFFINGELQTNNNDLQYHPERGLQLRPSFKLGYTSNGDNSYVFKWVYHQPFGSRQRNRIILSDIKVVGDSRGTALTPRKCQRGTAAPAESTNCDPCAVGHYAEENGMEQCVKCPSKTFTNQIGSADCELCGTGTNSSKDRTTCDISSCVFWGKSHQCFDLDHELLDTYTCAISRNNNIARSSGRVANVFYNEDVEPSITLHYSKGEPCGSGYSYTDVEFLCDLNYVHSYEGLSLVPSNDSCVTKFQWRNEAACRKCDLIARQGDYIKQNSECKDDVQHVSFVKAARCNGPVVLKTETQGCSESYPVTLPFVLLGLGLLFILVCVIIVVGIRNQKLSERYEMLVNDSISQRGSGPARDSGEV